MNSTDVPSSEDDFGAIAFGFSLAGAAAADMVDSRAWIRNALHDKWKTAPIPARAVLVSANPELPLRFLDELEKALVGENYPVLRLSGVKIGMRDHMIDVFRAGRFDYQRLQQLTLIIERIDLVKTTMESIVFFEQLRSAAATSVLGLSYNLSKVSIMATAVAENKRPIGFGTEANPAKIALPPICLGMFAPIVIPDAPSKSPTLSKSAVSL